MEILFHERPIRTAEGDVRNFLVGQLLSRRRSIARVDVDIHIVDGCVWVMELYTEPEYRKMGYATVLFSVLLQQYVNVYDEWRLAVYPFAIPSQHTPPLTAEQLVKFYEKFGFEVDEQASAKSDRPIMFLTRAALQRTRFKLSVPPLSE